MDIRSIKKSILKSDIYSHIYRHIWYILVPVIGIRLCLTLKTIYYDLTIHRKVTACNFKSFFFIQTNYLPQISHSIPGQIYANKNKCQYLCVQDH